MKKFYRLLFLMLLFCSLLTASALAAPNDDMNTITIKGYAQRQVSPDTAFIVIGVVTQHEKVEMSIQQNAAKIDKIIRSLSNFGIVKGDINTSSFDLRPVYTTGNDRKISAYTLENLLTIKVKDLANIGNILDTAFFQGANRLDGIRFTVSNADNLQKDLLQEAVRDGINKAKLVAGAAGRNIGVLLKADVGNNTGSYPEARMIKSMNDTGGFAASQVFAGNITLTADVVLVYELR